MSANFCMHKGRLPLLNSGCNFQLPSHGFQLQYSQDFLTAHNPWPVVIRITLALENYSLIITVFLNFILTPLLPFDLFVGIFPILASWMKDLICLLNRSFFAFKILHCITSLSVSLHTHFRILKDSPMYFLSLFLDLTDDWHKLPGYIKSRQVSWVASPQQLNSASSDARQTGDHHYLPYTWTESAQIVGFFNLSEIRQKYFSHLIPVVSQSSWICQKLILPGVHIHMKGSKTNIKTNI